MLMTEGLFGTPGPDEFAASRDGQTLFGRGGMDRLSTTFNDTFLSGGDGADSLFATVLVERFDRTAAVARAAIAGGSGNDYIIFDLQARSEGDATALSVTDTGSGDLSVRPGYGTASVFGWAVSTGGGTATVINTAHSGSSGGSHLSLGATAGLEAGTEGRTKAVNIFEGGAAHDLVSLYALANPSGKGSLAINRATGGEGADRLHASTEAKPGGSSLAMTEMNGGKDNDTLYVENWFRGAGSGGRSLISEDGGAGADFLYAANHAGASARFDNRLSGGDGADQLNSRIHYGAAEGSRATQVLSGEAGDDLIISAIVVERFVAPGGTNDDVQLLGGQGDDDIRFTSGSFVGDPQMDITVDRRFRVTLDASGGAGDDRLTVAHDLSSVEQGSQIATRCDGGRGDDDISVATRGTVTAMLDLLGGAGNDTLVATSLLGPAAEHRISGGAGNDRIVSEIDAAAEGLHVILGGTGDDDILVSGGASRINGGSGDDTLAGNGREVTMIGGLGADVFVIAAGGDGTRTIADLDRDDDTLQVTMLNPSGAGTLEDLLGTTTVQDLGPGKDVVVRFAVGLTLIIEDVGTGSADRLTDIVDSFLF